MSLSAVYKMSDEKNKTEENYVVVIDQAPAQHQGVESKTSKRADADESRPPRTPRLPSVKSTKAPDPEKPNEIKLDTKVPKSPFLVIPQQPSGQETPIKDPPEDKVAELRTHQQNVEWATEEEAGGLSRTGSRSSRVSRAVRLLFCCGARAEPADEDNMSSQRGEVPQESSITQDTTRTIKKELTWSDDDYLQKVYLKSMAETRCPLEVEERRASVGPHKSATAFRRASGLTIVVPKKSTRNITDFTTGINISISKSKKSIPSSKSGVVICSSSADVKSTGDAAKRDEKRAVKVDIEVPYKKIFNVVRSKLDFVRNKFYSVRNLNSS